MEQSASHAFCRRRCYSVMLGALAAISFSARAQSPDGDVTGAARAFEAGLRAQLSRDYATAAARFELADRLAPSAPALRSAIRNFEAADNLAHAATLAARALERYASDADTRRLAESVLSRARAQLADLKVRCAAPCQLAVDGRPIDPLPSLTQNVYLEPGDHDVLASYDGGRRTSRSLRLSAGATAELSLAPSEISSPSPRRRGVSPIYVGAGAAVTIALAATLIWSGVDTLAARDQYVQHPTEAGYRDGAGRETRTNALIGCLSVVGATTVALAVFTDWRRVLGSRRASVARWIPRPELRPGLASVSLTGQF
jgi:hypothetical protein